MLLAAQLDQANAVDVIVISALFGLLRVSRPRLPGFCLTGSQYGAVWNPIVAGLIFVSLRCGDIVHSPAPSLFLLLLLETLRYHSVLLLIRHNNPISQLLRVRRTLSSLLQKEFVLLIANLVFDPHCRDGVINIFSLQVVANLVVISVDVLGSGTNRVVLPGIRLSLLFLLVLLVVLLIFRGLLVGESDCVPAVFVVEEFKGRLLASCTVRVSSKFSSVRYPSCHWVTLHVA